MRAFDAPTDWQVCVVLSMRVIECRFVRTFRTLESAKIDFLIWCDSPHASAVSLKNPDGALVWIHATP